MPGPGAPDDAVRWLGGITLGGESLGALFQHPPASCRYELEAPFAGRCSVRIGLLPEAIQAHPGGLVFTLTACRSAGSARVVRTRLTPTQANAWHALDVAFPAPGHHDSRLTITVETAIAAGATSAWAWAVTTPPEISRPRTLHELTGAVRTGRDLAKSVGWRRALRQLWHGPRGEDDTISYPSWLQQQPPESDPDAERATQATWPTHPLISVITPAFNTRPDWLQACYQSLCDQTYPHWQWCICDDASPDPASQAAFRTLRDDPRVRTTRLPVNGGISAASNAALALATGELVVLLDHDDALPPSALHHIADAFVADPTLELLYSDEDKLEIDGTRTDPYLKPDWSPELFLSTMYTCHATAATRDLVERAGGFRQGFEGAQDYDLWLRMVDLTTRVHHVPRVLYHWRKVDGSTAATQEAKPWANDAGRRALESCLERRGLAARVSPGATAGRYRIEWPVPDALTSIVIPTYGADQASPRHQALVARMVRSVRETTAARATEYILVTDDGTVPPLVGRELEGLSVQVVAVPGPFNFSRRINAGAARATGTMLLLANDDLEATHEGWLDALLEYAQQPEIGAVGARLDFTDGRLQHAGLVLGVRGIAAHAFHEAPSHTTGYFGNVISPRNVAAVTAACMATRRDVFERVQGFDEQLPIDFNDVDYCLKLQAIGLRVVYTPYARLHHHEGASLGTRRPSTDAQALMRERWASQIERDPYYHPRLSRAAVDFRLSR